jgi:hypothetical protein
MRRKKNDAFWSAAKGSLFSVLIRAKVSLSVLRVESVDPGVKRWIAGIGQAMRR